MSSIPLSSTPRSAGPLPASTAARPPAVGLVDERPSGRDRPLVAVEPTSDPVVRSVRELRMPRPEPATFVPIQFLRPDGTLTELGRSCEAPLEQVRGFYRDMLLARRLDSEALALQRQGELGLWLMCWGQEAAQVGSIRAVRPQDHVFPSYREHAAALCRGVTPGELLTQWRGNAHSGWDPRAHGFHIYSLVLGSQTLHATGYAIGVQLDRSDEVVLTYFGDGAASQGDVNEALNWSAVVRAPMVFFCQNNQWAISTPSSAQSGAPLHQRAAGFGLDSYLVDGNDVLAVHAVTRAAAEGARSGGGPAFVEAVTYRMAGHSTSDDPTRYRTPGEAEVWAARDPLARIETYLRSRGTDDDYFDRLQVESDALAQEVRTACLSFTAPSASVAFEHVFADLDPQLLEEERQFRAYAASFADVAPAAPAH